MSEREELAKVIESVYWINGNKFRRSETDVAAAILAAGYRKLRTITTVEDLDALGRISAILASNGAVWVNDGDTEEPWASLAEDFHGGPVWVNGDGIELPATVLHEGDKP